MSISPDSKLVSQFPPFVQQCPKNADNMDAVDFPSASLFRV